MRPQANSNSARRRFPALVLATVISSLPVHAAVMFDQPFSPQEGLTPAIEQPWRQEVCLNGSWDFQPVPLPEGYKLENGAPMLPEPAADGWSATKIRIPSPWNVNGIYGGRAGRLFPSYPTDWDTTRMAWMRRQFTVPAGWEGKRIVLHFEAVLGWAQIVVNGTQVAENFENSLPFDVDVTDFVKLGGENTLMVGVRQASLFNIQGKYGKLSYVAGPPFLMQLAGIWQDVFLQAVPPLRVEEVVVRPWVDRGQLELVVTVKNNTPVDQEFDVSGKIHPWINEAGTDVLSAPVPKWSLGEAVFSLPTMVNTVIARSSATITLQVPVADHLKFWTPDTPNLYGLVFDLVQDGKTMDRSYERFGWRQWGIKGNHVTLNGKPLQLLGDAATINQVQILSRRYVWSYYKALKDVGANATRLHVVVRPRYYLEMADEMGVAILDESEIWASAMDYNYDVPDFWLRFESHLDRLIKRDRNFASVFGWSICNEIQSALWFKGVPRELWPPVIDKVVGMVDVVHELDPTRPWISSDGDGDFHGRMPTYVYHYGDPPDWERAAPGDKPFSLGEAGSMIWGSPVVYAAYNGERSFESAEGAAEGTAIEIYEYIRAERKLAAFTSIFTFEGSALKSLPIGLPEGHTGPTADDGIVFGPMVEGQPGIQPERILPFSTKFNPGWDPKLPLYEPTVVFESMKAAYAPGGPAPCKWDHRPEAKPLPKPPPATIKQVGFVGAEDGALRRALESSGVPMSPNIGDAALLVIDGATLTDAQVAGAKRQMASVLKKHGSVFVWVAPENLERANAVLPAAVSLVPDNGSGLYADREAPETASMSLASLYFHDQSDPVILKSGLTGPLVETSQTLIKSNTIRRRWFSSGNTVQHPALIKCASGGGNVYVTSLMPDVRCDRRMDLMRHLYANLGVVLGEPTDKYSTGFDGAGYVRAALMAGCYQGERYPAILDHDFLGNEATIEPKLGEKAGIRTWTLLQVPGDGNFDFLRLSIPGTEGSFIRPFGSEGKPEALGRLAPELLDGNGYLEPNERVTGTLPGLNCTAYLSFWVYSPESTGGAGTPSLSMVVACDDGTKVWLNHEQVFNDPKVYGPGLTDVVKVPLEFRNGWNHLLVKSGQLDGAWSFSARFESSDPALVEKLRTAPTRPE